MALSCLAALLFVATQTYARKEHAVRFPLPTTGIARIMPPRPGTISAVAVVEGQHVERGAPLMTVTDSETSEQGENLDAAKAVNCASAAHRLAGPDRPGTRKVAARGATRCSRRSTAARQDFTEFKHQRAIQAERIEIAQQQLSGALELAGKGYLSRVELRRRQDAHLAEQQSETSLAKERRRKQAELAALRDNLRQLPMATARAPHRTRGGALPKSTPG